METINQKAYHLIDVLSDDSVHAIVEVMRQMLSVKKVKEYKNSTPSTENEKMQTFRRLQEIRKQLTAYNISENERADALE